MGWTSGEVRWQAFEVAVGRQRAPFERFSRWPMFHWMRLPKGFRGVKLTSGRHGWIVMWGLNDREESAVGRTTDT